MIKIESFKEKRKQLRASIARRKRELKMASTNDAPKIAKAIIDEEEQLAVLTFMIEDQTAMIRELYDSQCYGPPQ